MSKKLYAVYGSLRKGLGNHRVLGNSVLLGECKTSPNFTLYSLSSFPGLVKGGETAVTLEVYEVDDSRTERNLDSLEGYISENNPHNFYNKEVIETPYGEAFVYYINRNMSGYNIVESGDWTEYKLNK